MISVGIGFGPLIEALRPHMLGARKDQRTTL
jgi:hypothetical protein